MLFSNLQKLGEFQPRPANSRINGGRLDAPAASVDGGYPPRVRLSAPRLISLVQAAPLRQQFGSSPVTKFDSVGSPCDPMTVLQ